MNTALGMACLCLGSAVLAAAEVPLESGQEPGAWSLNADGGTRPEWTADAEVRHGAAPALRVRYRDAEPHWGNLQHAVSVPADATALSFWLYVHRAAPGAAMHVWFMEPDGDAWVQRVDAEGQGVDGLTPGWRRVELPVGRFHFDPRGAKTRGLAGANRMLLGCNFGDLEVTVADFAFQVRGTAQAGAPPRTEPWQVEPGQAGRAAVLDDAGFPVVGAGSDPKRLAAWLRAAGWGVTPVRAGDLLDPQRLNRTAFDLLVLANGAAFPAQAAEPFRAFLEAGGKWINLGGYALDQPMLYDGRNWLADDCTMTVRDADSGRVPASLNTRQGKPGDTLGLGPEQIGTFDPAYQLRHAQTAAAAPGQSVIPEDVDLTGPFEGWAAVAMTGSNSPVFPVVHARWVPLLVSRDLYGRDAGPLAAATLHFSGPYRGSAWAFAGVTNADLLADEEASTSFVRLADYLRRSLFLHSVETDLACYHDGEAVTLRARAVAFGPEAEHVRVRLSVQPGLPEAGAAEVFGPVDEADLAAGGDHLFEWTWKPGTFGADFYTVTVRLERRAGAGFEAWDQLQTGFVAWQPAVIARGLPIRFRDNYFGGDTGAAQFLTGSNQTGMAWFSANENPLVWARDFQGLRDTGIRLLRYLHFSPFAAEGYAGKGQHSPLDLAKEPPLRLQRQTDAIVQLLQKHGIAMFLALHDWVGVELSDAELEAERAWAAYWCGRYRDVPGIFYDVQNEPSVGVPEAPHVTALWEEWLAARYGSREQAWQAWGQAGAAPARLDVKPGPGGWGDLKSRDLNEFKVVLLNRWVKANREGIKAGDPEAPMTVGYLPHMPPADKLLGAAHVDFSNTHYYGSLRDLLLQVKLIDRRFEGKGFSVGEFGAQAAHDARANGQTGDRADASAEWFLAVTHATFALGGAFVGNWDWKEFQDCVFPWGLCFSDLNPKPVARVYRCASRLLGSVSPAYGPPEVYLVVPDSHRLGATWGEAHAAVLHALDLLLRCQVDFGVVNERALAGAGGVPAGAKALLWPVPYCPEDAVFEAVRGWVEKGGVLYLSGDVQFDADRRPSRAARRTALGLPACEAKPPAETPAERWTQPSAEVTVGRGRVFHVPAPLEFRANAGNRAVYLRFLSTAGVARIALEPDATDLLAGTLPLADGGRALGLVNTGEQPLTVTWAPARVTLTVPGRRSGFVAVDGAGRVRALEGVGVASLAGQPLVAGDGHWMLLADEPARDLRQAAAWSLMPLQPGEFRLPGWSAAGQPTAVFSEPYRGQARILARLPLTRTDGVWRLAVPADLVGTDVRIAVGP